MKRTDIERAARVLMDARPFPVLTGAGISVESGIPTFHGPEGLWSRYDPYEYGHIDTFLRRPERTWELLMEIIRTSIGAAPNEAHRTLARFQERGWAGPVITQNVDGLHTLAGSTDVIELHGNARRIRCMKCGNVTDISEEDLDTFQISCFCGGVKKPDVVLYGERLPLEALGRSQRSCESAGAVLVVGTSGIVNPAAMLPHIVLSGGGSVVEIGPEDTEMTRVATVSIRAKAVEGMLALEKAVLDILQAPLTR